MGFFDNMKERNREKGKERMEREFADEDYRMEQFEDGKDTMLSCYKFGCGVDDEDGCKGDINRSYSFALAFIPDSYRQEFKEYVLSDPEVKKILNQSSSRSSDDSDDDDNEEKVEKYRKMIEEYREVADGDYGLFISEIDGWFKIYKRKSYEEDREIFLSLLTKKEKKDLLEFMEQKKSILEDYDEEDKENFVKSLKRWYKNTNYELAFDLLCDLSVDDYITEEEKDEIELCKSEKTASSKNEKEKKSSSDAPDIKAKLEKLKALKEEGLISDEDFEKKKSALLDLI